MQFMVGSKVVKLQGLRNDQIRVEDGDQFNKEMQKVKEGLLLHIQVVLPTPGIQQPCIIHDDANNELTIFCTHMQIYFKNLKAYHPRVS